MEMAEGSERDGGVANPGPAAAQKPLERDDDGLHRAGRVTREQF